MINPTEANILFKISPKAGRRSPIPMWGETFKRIHTLPCKEKLLKYPAPFNEQTKSHCLQIDTIEILVLEKVEQQRPASPADEEIEQDNKTVADNNKKIGDDFVVRQEQKLHKKQSLSPMNSYSGEDFTDTCYQVPSRSDQLAAAAAGGGGERQQDYNVEDLEAMCMFVRRRTTFAVRLKFYRDVDETIDKIDIYFEPENASAKEKFLSKMECTLELPISTSKFSTHLGPAEDQTKRRRSSATALPPPQQQQSSSPSNEGSDHYYSLCTDEAPPTEFSARLIKKERSDTLVIEIFLPDNMPVGCLWQMCVRTSLLSTANNAGGSPSSRRPSATIIRPISATATDSSGSTTTTKTTNVDQSPKSEKSRQEIHTDNVSIVHNIFVIDF